MDSPRAGRDKLNEVAPEITLFRLLSFNQNCKGLTVTQRGSGLAICRSDRAIVALNLIAIAPSVEYRQCVTSESRSKENAMTRAAKILLGLSFCFFWMPGGVFAQDDGWRPATRYVVMYPSTFADEATACPVEQPVIVRRQVAETTYREERFKVQRPVWETEEREERVTVRRPVYETADREEAYTVRRPVYETQEREEKYTVLKPVYETSEREEQVTVRRPVYETSEREEQVTVYEPSTSCQCSLNAFGQWQLVPATTTVARVVTRKVPVQTVRYVEEREVRKIPVQTMRYVEEEQVRKVQVPTVRYVEEQKVRKVAVQTVRYVEEEQTRKVPQQVCRMVEEEIVRRVPVITYRDE